MTLDYSVLYWKVKPLNHLQILSFADFNGLYWMLYWSGKRGSNSRPRPWQGRALPTELFPHESCFLLVPGARLELARPKRPRDFKSLVSTDFTTRAQNLLPKGNCVSNAVHFTHLNFTVN